MNHQTGNTEQRTTTAGSTTGEDAKQKAQQAVDQTRENVKQKASELSDQARQKASEVTEQAKEKASEAAHQAQQKAESAATDQKEQAAHRLDSVAESLHRGGRELREHDEEQLGAYVEKAATQIEGFSTYLHDRNINQLLNDVQGFARQQPELFTVGALAAGFLVGRFFKSTSRSSSSMGQSSYPSYSRREYIRESYPGAGGRSYNRSYRAGVGQSRYPSSDFVDRQYESAQDEHAEYTDMQGTPYSRTSHEIPADRPPIPSQAEGERSPGSTAGDSGLVGASTGTSTTTSTSSTGQSHSPDRDQSDHGKSGKSETGKSETGKSETGKGKAE